MHKIAYNAQLSKLEEEKTLKPYLDEIKSAATKGEFSYTFRGSLKDVVRKYLVNGGFKIRTLTEYGRGAYGEDEYDTCVSWNS